MVGGVVPVVLAAVLVRRVRQVLTVAPQPRVMVAVVAIAVTSEAPPLSPVTRVGPVGRHLAQLRQEALEERLILQVT